MNESVTIKFSDYFGAYCVNGSQSLAFLRDTLLPILNNGNGLVLDFENVRMMNSSFSNALFGNLIRKLGRPALSLICITNANDLIKNEIKSGIGYGIKLSEAAAAA